MGGMAPQRTIPHPYGGNSSPRKLDRLLADLAARQHGVVARRQLLEAGAGPRAIELRLERGRLHSIHAGVYAVGHSLLSLKGRWMAAVLAGGARAVLSHRSAAALWEIRPFAGARVAVIVWPRRHPRALLDFHGIPVPDDEVTEVDGIPTTAPARTLFDLASVLGLTALERAIDQAEIRRLFGLLSLEDLLDRHPGARGSRALKAILAAKRIGVDVARSELEERFLAFLDKHKLSRPRVNMLVETPGGGHLEVDCAWPDQRLVVELDGHATHGTARGYERDRARDRALAAAGWRVVRITWRQLHEEPIPLAVDLRSLLAAAESLKE